MSSYDLYDKAVLLQGKLLEADDQLRLFIAENSIRIQEVTGVPLKQRSDQGSIYESTTGRRLVLQLYLDLLARNLGAPDAASLK